MLSELGVCGECGRNKPIVLICLIGCQLCAECQEKQNRISHEELNELVMEAASHPDATEDLNRWVIANMRKHDSP